VVGPTHMPTILDDDRDAILAAIKTCNARDLNKARVVRIKDTLHMNEISISESMLAEARMKSEITVIGSVADMVFDSIGNILDDAVPELARNVAKT